MAAVTLCRLLKSARMRLPSVTRPSRTRGIATGCAPLMPSATPHTEHRHGTHTEQPDGIAVEPLTNAANRGFAAGQCAKALLYRSLQFDFEARLCFRGRSPRFGKVCHRQLTAHHILRLLPTTAPLALHGRPVDRTSIFRGISVCGKPSCTPAIKPITTATITVWCGRSRGFSLSPIM